MENSMCDPLAENEHAPAEKQIPLNEISKCQVGIPFSQWRGNYLKVDFPLNVEVLQELPPLMFHVVKTFEKSEDDVSNELLSMIPTTWFAKTNDKLFLYPPPTYCVAGKSPTNWASRTFDRHYYPQSSWLEYEAFSILTSKERAHKSVLRKYKKLLKGVPPDQITDSDIPLEKLRKRKRTLDDSLSQKTHTQPNQEEQGVTQKGVSHVQGHNEEANADLEEPTSECESMNSTTSVVIQPDFVLPDNAEQTFNYQTNESHTLQGEAELQEMQAGKKTNEGVGNPEPDFHISMGDGIALLNNLGNAHHGLQYDVTGESTIWTHAHYTEPLAGQHMVAPNMQRQHNPAENRKDSSAESASSLSTQSFSFSSDNGQHACCTAVQSALTKLCFDIAQIRLMLETNHTLLSRERGQPKYEMEYHESVIDSYNLQLPCDSVEKVVALDTLLQNTSLSVSFVMKFGNELNGLKTLNSFAAAVYTSFVSRQTSESLQWKSIQRGEDCRQGIRHLLNFIAVIGVSVRRFAALSSGKKEYVKTSTIIEFIQNSRKQEGELFRKEKNISAGEAKILAKEAVPVSLGMKCTEKEIIANIDRAILKLELAVSKFKMPEMLS